MLNESKGNMYKFVTHTWNPIKGECSHDCVYCYMKSHGKQKQIRLVEKELKDDLRDANFIFVGSSTDMFASDIPEMWIKRVLRVCNKYNNRYLFQSKNTKRFNNYDIIHSFPSNTVLGTTIETNNNDLLKTISNAPHPWDRANMLSLFKDHDKMVTIEPILDFDLFELVHLVANTSPSWVNIGADSKGHNLPEPTWKQVQELINELSKFTDVHLKDNLKRLRSNND